MITGYGVAESVKHYNIYGGNLKGKRVIVQGWGNVDLQPHIIYLKKEQNSRYY